MVRRSLLQLLNEGGEAVDLIGQDVAHGRAERTHDVEVDICVLAFQCACGNSYGGIDGLQLGADVVQLPRAERRNGGDGGGSFGRRVRNARTGTVMLGSNHVDLSSRLMWP